MIKKYVLRIFFVVDCSYLNIIVRKLIFGPQGDLNLGPYSQRIILKNVQLKVVLDGGVKNYKETMDNLEEKGDKKSLFSQIWKSMLVKERLISLKFSSIHYIFHYFNFISQYTVIKHTAFYFVVVILWLTMISIILFDCLLKEVSVVCRGWRARSCSAPNASGGSTNKHIIP